MIDPKLKEWATETQQKYIDAVNEHGSYRKAAAALGMDQRGLERGIARAKISAALRGYSPEHGQTHTTPATQIIKGVSSLYDADGNLRQQWVKTQADQQAVLLAVREAIAAMKEDVPREERVGEVGDPEHYDQRLCTVYTLTDSHVGMLAWGEETGADWDLKIAEDTLVKCFAKMIAAAPDSAVGFVNQLGDFLHWDHAEHAITPTSGHQLDADGRMPKMVRVAVRIIRRVVKLALLKHERVVLLCAEGNHDLGGSVWMRELFRALYEDEPRVAVIDQPLPYYVYHHGKTMLAFHHGHLIKKNDQLPLLFATKYPTVWGATTKRYVHVGHRHHVEEKEHPGMKVVQHSTLAAKDAYAARGGWESERQALAITYSKEHGEVSRVTVTPEMIAT